MNEIEIWNNSCVEHLAKFFEDCEFEKDESENVATLLKETFIDEITDYIYSDPKEVAKQIFEIFKSQNYDKVKK